MQRRCLALAVAGVLLLSQTVQPFAAYAALGESLDAAVRSHDAVSASDQFQTDMDVNGVPAASNEEQPSMADADRLAAGRYAIAKRSLDSDSYLAERVTGDGSSELALHSRDTSAFSLWDIDYVPSDVSRLAESDDAMGDAPAEPLVAIANAQTGNRIGVSHAGDECEIDLAAPCAESSQFWVLKRSDDGFMLSPAVDSTRCLAVALDGAESGPRLVLVDSEASDDSFHMSWEFEAIEPDIEGGDFEEPVKPVPDEGCSDALVPDAMQPDGPVAEEPAAAPDAAPPIDIDDLAREHAGELPDGTYIISSALRTRSVMDVWNGSSADGANVQLFESNMTGAQRWTVAALNDGSGYVRITNPQSGKALDVWDARAESGTNVQLFRWNATRAQLWLPVRQTDGSYVFYSAVGNGQVLDVAGGSVANGTNIGLWKENGTGAQRFTVTSCAVSVPAGARVVEDGVYQLSPSSNEAVALDLGGASPANGARIQLFHPNGTDAQAFRITYGDDGFYDVRVIASGKALDVTDGDLLSGTPIQQWECYGVDSPNQRWKIECLPDGAYRFVSKSTGLVLDAGASHAADPVMGCMQNGGSSQAWRLKPFAPMVSEGCYTLASGVGLRVLDVAGASIDEGAAMQLYRSHGTLAQKWWVRTLEDGSITLQCVGSGKYLALDEAGAAVQISDARSERARWCLRVDFNGRSLINESTGQALDVYGAVDADGTKVHGYRPNGTNAQAWRFEPTPIMTDGFYFVASASDPRYVLDVAAGSKDDHANVHLYKGNRSLAQTWWVRSTANGYFTFTAGCSAKDLDVAGESALSGTNVQQLTRTGSGAQCWTFEMGEHGLVAHSYVGTALDLAGAPASCTNVVANTVQPSSVTQGWLFRPAPVPSKIGYQNPSQFFQVSQNSVTLPQAAYYTPYCFVTPSRISIDATREQCIEAFIARAYEYLGSPYVWNYSLAPGVGVDCSGLVMQCCYATGMNLDTYNPYHHWYDPWHSHDANNMSADSRFMHVNFKDRQRGDLIFSPGHVSIYIGDDTIIEAYSPREGVRMASVYSSTPITAVARPFV